VALRQDLAYVANGAGLTILDLADPGSPVVAGSESVPGVSLQVSLTGSLAVVAAGSSGLHVIDVTSAADPALLGSADTPGFANTADVSGSMACVADGKGGIVLVDIADPAQPLLRGGAPTLHPALDVVLSGHHAFVGTVIPVEHSTAGRLEVFDIEDPDLPIHVGGIELPGGAQRVAIIGNLAYVASPTGGVLVLDISTPASPVVVGGIGTPESATSVTAGGGHVLAVDRNGVLILDPHCTAPQPVEMNELEAAPMIDLGAIRVRWRAPEGVFAGFEVRRAVGTDPPLPAYRTLVSLPAETPPAGGWWSVVDRDIEPARDYSYRIVGQRLDGGEEQWGPVFVTAPLPTARLVIWPNPTASSTLLSLDLPRPLNAQIHIYDPAGRQVRRLFTGSLAGGSHRFAWDGTGDGGRALSSGTYFVRIQSARGGQGGLDAVAGAEGRITLIR
jgi:hypothetical protein